MTRSQNLADNQKPKQIRRPKFGHDRALAKPYPLDHLLSHPQALPALVSLDRHGLLTNGMMQDLLFRDHRAEDPTLKNPEEAMKRQANRLIIRLKDAELIERRMVQLISDNGFPYAYPFNILSRNGAEVLTRYYAKHGGTLRWSESVLKLKPHTYAHSLEINRFFVALQRACWAEDIELSYWIDDRQLATIDRTQTLFEHYPDAFFMLEKDDHTFTHFLEIDRGTESLYLVSGDHDWATKAERYSRLLTTNFARAPFFAELPPPIVLIVVTTGERRTANILAEILGAGAHESYWATTAKRLYLDKHTDRFWQPIWNTPDGEVHSLLDRVCLSHLS